MRQLVAILFTDIVGYSQQMDQDESGALRRLEEHNRLLDAAVVRHGGRVIKTVGDAYVVVFQSSVAAVECALDAQRSFDLHNSIVEEGERIQVRMGIHQGDVMVREDGDLFGEAVNIAARLEPLAPPGAICVSLAVLEQVRHKVHAEVSPLGEVALKNISGLVELYILRPGSELVVGFRTVQRKALSTRRRWPWGWIAGGVVTAAVVCVVLLVGRKQGAVIHRGGVLHVAVGYDAVDKWDVYSESYDRNYLARHLVLEALSDVTPDGDLDPAHSILEQVESEGGDRRLRLKLRGGVFFHDHPCFPGGTGPMANAGDVVFSIEQAARAGKLALPVAGVPEFLDGKAAAIAGVTTSGDWGITLEMSSPAPFYRDGLNAVALQPRAAGACQVQRLIGTGPFRFAAKPETGDEFTLLASPRYWQHAGGEHLPYLDSVVIGRADAPAATLTRLEAENGVDIYMPRDKEWPAIFTFADPPALVPRYRDLRNVSVATEVTRNQITAYELACVARPGGPLSDPRMRRAVALAMDRQELVAAYPSLLERPATRFLRPPVFAADGEVTELRTDLAEAKRLLAAAGHPGGTGVPELVIASRAPAAFQSALASELGRLGLVLRFSENSALDPDKAKAGGVDGVLEEASQTLVGGEEPEMGGFFHQSVAIHSLELKLSGTSSRSDRGQIYNQIEKAMLDDLSNIPIAWVSDRLPYNAYAVGKRVRGFSDPVTQYARFQNLPETWLEPQ